MLQTKTPPRLRALALILITAILVMPSLLLPTANAAASLDTQEAAFCRLINNYRAQRGLKPLLVSRSLSADSDWHTYDMASKNYFSHTDSLGRDPFRRMAAFGYSYYTYKGENIAAGNSTAQGTFDQWRVSSGHNANMLNANYKVIGIGRNYGSTARYRWYWNTTFGGVVDFGAFACPA
jgi:uncharacterized protein YkwD